MHTLEDLKSGALAGIHHVLWKPANGNAVPSDFDAALLSSRLPVTHRAQLQAIAWRSLALVEDEIAVRTAS